MKKSSGIWISFLSIISVFLILTSSCKKNDDDTIKDTDGNVYHSVKIGSQEWMVENLKTTKYNDGTSIPLITDSLEWLNLITPGYCWYNNDAPAYSSTYGALYNWYAVNSGKLAPKGWHVPTDAEWTILTDFLGGLNVAGGKMKESGYKYWEIPNNGATNESGFTALPGGFRNIDFGQINTFGWYWTATDHNAYNAWGRILRNTSKGIVCDVGQNQMGRSIRCVRD